MRSTRALTLTAAVAALPLLAGCGQGGQPADATAAAESQSQGAVQASVTSTADPTTADPTTAATSPGGAGASSGEAGTNGAGTSAPAGSAAPTEDRTASTPEVSGGQEGAGGTLPAVADPCAGKCDETTRATVDHPKYGPMEVVAYTLTTTPDTAPQGKRASYAVYQNGNPVGHVSSPESSSVITFGNGPAIGDQLWHLNGMNPVDKYGNVYFSDNEGVTVITPTDTGFDSHGTMPGAEKPQYPFEHAGLSIDTSGEPTVVQKILGKDHIFTGETVKWSWNGSQFVATK